MPGAEATPQTQPGLTGRDLFGVVVRTSGLMICLWALYTLLYYFYVQAFNAPTEGRQSGLFVAQGVIFLLFGSALLRGGWLVRLAYGRSTS